MRNLSGSVTGVSCRVTAGGKVALVIETTDGPISVAEGTHEWRALWLSAAVEAPSDLNLGAGGDLLAALLELQAREQLAVAA